MAIKSTQSRMEKKNLQMHLTHLMDGQEIDALNSNSTRNGNFYVYVKVLDLGLNRDFSYDDELQYSYGRIATR